MGLDFAKCRMWEVKFEIPGRIKSLPYPGEVVEEIQSCPEYRIECKLRKNFTGCQLSCTLEGEGVFRSGKKEYRLTPGMAFMQNHNDTNTAYYYPKDGSGDWRFLWISFYSPTVEKIVRELVAQYGYIYHIPLDSPLIKKLKSYKNYRDTLQFLSPFEGARMIMDIITGLEPSTAPDKTGLTTQFTLSRQAQEYIFSNLANRIGVEDVAKELQVSREHLSRTFKSQTGETLMNYLIKKRMELACKLLISTNLSCKEIAGRTGYDNPMSFIRAFKKTVRLTPGELRRIGYAPEIR
ncbi:MAG: AraC family transcriptional regulator [Victivallaceae bacterium]